MSEEKLIYSFVLSEVLCKYFYHSRPKEYAEALERENQNEKKLCDSLNRSLHIQQMDIASSKLGRRGRKRARSSSPPSSEKSGWSIEKKEPRMPKEIKSLFVSQDEKWFSDWKSKTYEQFTKGERIIDNPGLLGRHEELLEKLLRWETFSGSDGFSRNIDYTLGARKYAQIRALSSGTFFCLLLGENYVSYMLFKVFKK